MNEMAKWPTRPRQPEVCPFLLVPQAGLRPLDCFKRHPARSFLDRKLCQSLQPQEAGIHSHSTATLERGGEGSLSRFGGGSDLVCTSNFDILFTMDFLPTNPCWLAKSKQSFVRLVKAVVFPAVKYKCESWTIKKVERRKLMPLNCGVGEDS